VAAPKKTGESLISIISRLGQNTLAALTGFVNYQSESIGEVAELAKENISGTIAKQSWIPGQAHTCPK